MNEREKTEQKHGLPPWKCGPEKALDIWDPGQHHPLLEREDPKGGGSNRAEMAHAQELSFPLHLCQWLIFH